MKKQKVVKGLAHIVNQEIGGKPLRKADNVISAGNFFNITFICCYSIVLMCYNSRIGIRFSGAYALL